MNANKMINLTLSPLLKRCCRRRRSSQRPNSARSSLSRMLLPRIGTPSWRRSTFLPTFDHNKPWFFGNSGWRRRKHNVWKHERSLWLWISFAYSTSFSFNYLKHVLILTWADDGGYGPLTPAASSQTDQPEKRSNESGNFLSITEGKVA